MASQSGSLGALEAKFFALMQLNQQTIVKLGEVNHSLNISASSEHELLKRLVRKGYIIRLKRGVFLVPKKLPAGGRWQPNEYYLISQYMAVYEADYYIGGPVAFHFHGVVQQIPNTITLYNDVLSGTRSLGNLQIVCIKTSKERLMGRQQNTLPDGATWQISNLARTVMDGIYDWQRFGSLPAAYGWLGQNLSDQKFLKEFVKLTAQCSNINTIRRVGCFLEMSGCSQLFINQLQGLLKTRKSYILLNPLGPDVGTKLKQWGVVCNVKFKRGND